MGPKKGWTSFMETREAMETPGSRFDVPNQCGSIDRVFE